MYKVILEPKKKLKHSEGAASLVAGNVGCLLQKFSHCREPSEEHVSGLRQAGGGPTSGRGE